MREFKKIDNDNNLVNKFKKFKPTMGKKGVVAPICRCTNIMNIYLYILRTSLEYRAN